ncbi:MAG: PIN domain-containing protein [Bacteroidetes bacterium]|jgi:predicted nucleic acid-binding protein|nr:PIN domain-containing protein [Bacteroidota bacterium]
MAEIFVDTAGWGHLVDASQAFHARAADIYRSGRRDDRQFITSNYVITELVALLTSPLRIPRPQVIRLVDAVKASPSVDVVHVDRETDHQAWRLLGDRPDKVWSLVDCSSFIIMRQRGISDVLTTDHHFEQAGFVRLLKR